MSRLRSVLNVGLAIAVAAIISAWVLGVHHRVSHPDVPGYPYVVEGLYSQPLLVALSALLIRRRPQHRVTWLFVGITVAAGLQGLTGWYAHESLAHPDGLPGATAALFVSSISQFTFVVATVLLFHIFPTGRVLSPGWRFVVWLIPPMLVGETLMLLSRAQPFPDDPIFASVVGPLASALPAWVISVLGALAFLWVVPFVGSIVHLVARYRRSAGVERQQLRWFVTAVVVAVAIIAVPIPPLTLWQPWAVGPALIWTSVGLAILRYRLYDLDRVVRRTFTYAILSASLAAIYASVVLLPAQVAGTGDAPDVVVAAAVLVSAGAFQPLRSRLQRGVDRRFNRARYDVSRTLEHFGARVRDDVDAAALAANLRSVVVAAFEPAGVGLWLVEAQAKGRGA